MDTIGKLLGEQHLKKGSCVLFNW